MEHQQGGMTFVEFIGFIISLFAMLYILLKQFLEDIKKKRDPKGYAEKQKKKEEALKKLMGEWGQTSHRKKVEESIEEEDEDITPILARKPISPVPPFKNAPHQPMPKGLAGSKQGDHLVSGYFMDRHGAGESEVQRIETPSRGALLVSQFPSRKELFIIKEIMDLPLSLRQDHW